MYNKSNVVMATVEYIHQLKELHNALQSCDLSMSVFANENPSIDDLEQIILRDEINFINVYYESVLIGYIVLESRSSKTVDFHWGLVKKNKYLPAIIKDCFEHCCKMDVETFIGWTPTENKIAVKIAKRMGFQIETQIDNYYGNGGSATLSIYKNEVNNG